jgi:hypothetical protein
MAQEGDNIRTILVVPISILGGQPICQNSLSDYVLYYENDKLFCKNVKTVQLTATITPGSTRAFPAFGISLDAFGGFDITPVSADCPYNHDISLERRNLLVAGQVGAAQTLCQGADPAPFASVQPAAGGTLPYAYQWEVAPSATGTYVEIAAATGETYDLPVQNTAGTAHYRRRVTDAASRTAYSNTLSVTTKPAPEVPSIEPYPDNLVPNNSSPCSETVYFIGFFGQWSLISQPAGASATISSGSIPGPVPLPSGVLQGASLPGTYLIEFTTTPTDCGSRSAQYSFVREELGVDAGPDASTCTDSYTLSPSPVGGVWSVVNQPIGAAASFEQNTVQGLTEPGIYTLRYVSSGGACAAFSSEVQISRHAPIAISAGADVVSCEDSYDLSPPVGGGSWSVVSQPAGASAYFLGGTVLGVGVPGDYVFSYTASNACGAFSDELTFTRLAPSAVSAGVDAATCEATYELAPSPAGGTWTILSQPAGASALLSQHSLTNLLVPGSYVLQYSMATNCGMATDAVVVTRLAPETVSAGADATTCEASYTLSPSAGGGSWSVVSQPAGASAQFASTTVSGLTVPGDYVFRYTVSGGLCASGADEFTLTRLEPPMVSAGPDAATCDTEYTLSPSPAGGTWTVLSQPAGVPPISISGNQVLGLLAGEYVLRYTLPAQLCAQVSDDLTLFSVADTRASAGNDVSTCATSLTLAGTPAGGSWTLINQPADSPPVSIVGNVASGMEAAGAYTFAYTSSSEFCGITTDQMTLSRTSESPSIVEQPRQLILEAGYAGQFVVNAQGQGLTYQWRKDGVDIPGATAASYLVSNASLQASGAYYSVLITPECGAPVLSEAAELRVIEPVVPSFPGGVEIIHAYPNPVHGSLSVSMKKVGTYELYLARMDGQTVYQASFTGDSHTIPDTTVFGQGMFFLYTTSPEGSGVQLVILQ